MDIVYSAVVLLAILAAALWLRDQLVARLRPTCRALVFLSLYSRENEDVLGAEIPLSTIHLYKVVVLSFQPHPGVELDGLGTGPIKVARAVVEEDSKHNVVLQLAPLLMPLDELESYASSLVTDLDWRRSQLEPPYPAVVPNNSFKPTPHRGVGHVPTLR